MTTSVRNLFGFVLGDPNPPTTPKLPSDLRKPQRELLYDLIERSNPGFKAKFPLSVLKFGTPSAIPVNGNDRFKNDTQIVVSSSDAAIAMGTVTVRYRRIEMATLFNGAFIFLDEYDGVSQSLTAAQWRQMVNDKYGLSTEYDDWGTGIVSLPAGSKYSTTMATTSKCYRGSYTIQYVPGKRKMEHLLAGKKNLAGRTWPTDNDFSKPKGSQIAYGLDFSPIKDTGMNAFTSPQGMPTNQNGTNPIFNAIINFLNANTDRKNWSDKGITVDGGITGNTWTRLSLPNALVPEANSKDFNMCVVMSGHPSAWFQGNLIFHYNN